MSTLIVEVSWYCTVDIENKQYEQSSMAHDIDIAVDAVRGVYRVQSLRQSKRVSCPRGSARAEAKHTDGSGWQPSSSQVVVGSDDRDHSGMHDEAMSR